MKLASRTLVDLLTNPANEDEFWMADLYRLRLATGQELRYTNTDVSVKVRYRDVVIASHPCAYWPMADSGGGLTPALDELPNGHDLESTTLPEFPFLDPTKGPISDGIEPIASLSFDGVIDNVYPRNTYVGRFREPDYFFHLLRSFTYEFWVWSPTEGGAGVAGTPIVGTRGAGRFEFWLDTLNKFRAHARVKTSTEPDYGDQTNPNNPKYENYRLYKECAGQDFVVGVPSSKLSASEWHHIVITFDGLYLRVFVDGDTENFSQSEPISERLDDERSNIDQKVYIGRSIEDSGAFFGGGPVYAEMNLAHLAIYPYAMAPREIAFHYEARNGIIFSAKGPPIDRDSVSEGTGLEVGELTITLHPRPEDTVPNTTLSLVKAASHHYLEDAELKVYRSFSPPSVEWPDPITGSSPSDTVLDTSDVADYGPILAVTGTILRFDGIASEVSVTSTELEINAKSKMILMDSPVPKNIFKPGCSWELYGDGCDVDKSVHRFATTVGPGSTRTIIHATTTPPTPPSGVVKVNYYALGHIRVRTGNMAGIVRAIKSDRDGVFILAHPLPFEPEVSVTQVDIYPGCDKTAFTCHKKFENFSRFRGFPLVPTSDIQLGMVGAI